MVELFTMYVLPAHSVMCAMFIFTVRAPFLKLYYLDFGENGQNCYTMLKNLNYNTESVLTFTEL
jgi:hypothetical protein